MAGTKETSRSYEDERVDLRREVGGVVCDEGAAEGVADQGEGGPGDGGAGEDEVDLGGVEAGVVGERSWGG